MNNLKIVVIEKPYNLLQSSNEVQSFLPKIFKLKLDGYRPHYQYGVMPIDDTDFWGTHLLLCKEAKDGLVPIMGLKAMTLKDSLLFKRNFPLFTHSLSSKGCEEHREYVQKWMNKYSPTGDIGYTCSLTISPSLRHDLELRKFFADLIKVFHYCYFRDYKIPHSITATSKRFKVDRTMSEVGYTYLRNDKNEVMPPFKAAGFAQEEFYIMHISDLNHSDSVKFLYNKYKVLWENRLTLKLEEENLAKVA